MRKVLAVAALLVSGCAYYEAPYPDHAYPAYTYGYAVHAAPAYTYRPRAYPPPRYRAWGPPGHRRHHHGDRRGWRD